uniref:RING-type E3 ubiquitin transferase n=1 Tax=Pseudonaja textilis TaxID=8673 RepID=A0A670ZH07_PSETE
MFENVAYLDRCWHRFCFRCVLEWSKNKAECPLCKQPFHSIVHSLLLLEGQCLLQIVGSCLKGYQLRQQGREMQKCIR